MGYKRVFYAGLMEMFLQQSIGMVMLLLQLFFLGFEQASENSGGDGKTNTANLLDILSARSMTLYFSSYSSQLFNIQLEHSHSLY